MLSNLPERSISEGLEGDASAQGSTVLLRQMKSVPWAGVSVAAVSIASPLAHAQPLEEQEIETQDLASKSGAVHWNAMLGAAVLSVSRYPGGEDRRLKVAPLFVFNLHYHDIFLSPFGLGWNAIDVGGLRAGPILGYEGGRSQSLDTRLEGLGDISRSLTRGCICGLPVEAVRAPCDGAPGAHPQRQWAERPCSPLVSCPADPAAAAAGCGS